MRLLNLADVAEFHHAVRVAAAHRRPAHADHRAFHGDARGSLGLA